MRSPDQNPQGQLALIAEKPRVTPFSAMTV
jgi:hypothetical protein